MWGLDFAMSFLFFFGGLQSLNLGLSENPETGETYSSIEQLIVQLKSLGITVVWSAVATIIIVLIIKKTVGLRVSEEVEAEGLDSAEHGETAYNFDA